MCACGRTSTAAMVFLPPSGSVSKSVFTISREGVQDADRDGLLGANRSNSLAIARICNNADRPIPRLHTRVEIANTLLASAGQDAPRGGGVQVAVLAQRGHA